jgi:hypothetical protein
MAATGLRPARSCLARMLATTRPSLLTQPTPTDRLLPLELPRVPPTQETTDYCPLATQRKHDSSQQLSSQERYAPQSAQPTLALSEQSRTTFEDIPIQEFRRIDSSSWFEQAKVFKIPDHHQDTTVSGRCMVVMGNSGSAIIAVPLCRYMDVTGEERSFLKSRLLLRPANTPVAEWLPNFPCKPLSIKLAHGRKMLNDVWINCAMPYTIHNKFIEVAWLGQLTEESCKALRKAYAKTQETMVNPDEVRRQQPNIVWIHVSFVWGYVQNLARLIVEVAP